MRNGFSRFLGTLSEGETLLHRTRKTEGFGILVRIVGDLSQALETLEELFLISILDD